MTDQQLDLDAIEARAAGLYERTASIDPDAHPDFGQLTDADVPRLVAEVRRLRAERDEFCNRVDTLTAVAKGNKRHVQELFLELQKAQAEVGRSRARTLTESEHDRAWHAIEGAAGEEGADPGTVLNAVLRALDLNPPTAPAARSAAV